MEPSDFLTTLDSRPSTHDPHSGKNAHDHFSDSDEPFPLSDDDLDYGTKTRSDSTSPPSPKPSPSHSTSVMNPKKRPHSSITHNIELDDVSGQSADDMVASILNADKKKFSELDDISIEHSMEDDHHYGIEETTSTTIAISSPSHPSAATARPMDPPKSAPAPTTPNLTINKIYRIRLNGVRLVARFGILNPKEVKTFVMSFSRQLKLYVGTSTKSSSKGKRKTAVQKAARMNGEDASRSSSSKSQTGFSDLLSSNEEEDITDTLDTLELMITILRSPLGTREHGTLWMRPLNDKGLTNVIPCANLPISFNQNDTFPKVGLDPSIIVKASLFLRRLEECASSKASKKEGIFYMLVGESTATFMLPVSTITGQFKVKSTNSSISKSTSGGGNGAQDEEQKQEQSIAEMHHDIDKGIVLNGSSQVSHNQRTAFMFSAAAAQDGRGNNSMNSLETIDYINVLTGQKRQTTITPSNSSRQKSVISFVKPSESNTVLTPCGAGANLKNPIPLLSDKEFRVDQHAPMILYTKFDFFMCEPTNHILLHIPCTLLADLVQSASQNIDTCSLLIITLSHKLKIPKSMKRGIVKSTQIETALLQEDVVQKRRALQSSRFRIPKATLESIDPTLRDNYNPMEQEQEEDDAAESDEDDGSERMETRVKEASCIRTCTFVIRGVANQSFDVKISPSKNVDDWQGVRECVEFDQFRKSLQSDSSSSHSASTANGNHHHQQQQRYSSNLNDVRVGVDENGNLTNLPNDYEELPAKSRPCVAIPLIQLIELLRDMKKCEDAQLTIHYPKENHSDIRYTLVPNTDDTKRAWRIFMIGTLLNLNSLDDADLLAMDLDGSRAENEGDQSENAIESRIDKFSRSTGGMFNSSFIPDINYEIPTPTVSYEGGTASVNNEGGSGPRASAWNNDDLNP